MGDILSITGSMASTIGQKNPLRYRGYYYDGGVWIPDNKQDGGPGWTVQFPGGGHEHRYPDGHVRTHNISEMIVGGALVVTMGVIIVFAVADDSTGVGVLDNALLPGAFEAFRKGVEMLGAY